MEFIRKRLDVLRINFKKFWKNASKSNLPQELVEITEKFIVSDSFKYTSNYWHSININIYKKFIKAGINRYTKNINVQHLVDLYGDSISGIYEYSNNYIIENTLKNVENVKIKY